MTTREAVYRDSDSHDIQFSQLVSILLLLLLLATTMLNV
jgi:hypothetical protein